MLKSLLVAAALLLASAPALAEGPTLKPGDPAPALQVKQWVKGSPVKGFEKNKLYVVEFWATWCGPCKRSIPHLTELANANKDVTFIGVSVWENKQDDVAPFVEKMGEKMNYTVAMDDVPEGKKGNEGAMAKNWMTASGSGGIPTAFIVDKTGHIAWIGHPMEMEEPLKQVIAGKWDLAAYAKQKAEEDALEEAGNQLGAEITRAMKAKDNKAALAAMDAAFAKTPKLEKNFGPFKFKLLLDSKDYDGAYGYGAKLVDGTLKDESNQLNGIAWLIVNPEVKHEKRDLKLALKAAERANELTKGKDFNVLDTLARVHFDSGNAAKAIEFQTQAVELAKDNPDAQKELQDRLDEYKKGAH